MTASLLSLASEVNTSAATQQVRCSRRSLLNRTCFSFLSGQQTREDGKPPGWRSGTVQHTYENV